MFVVFVADDTVDQRRGSQVFSSAPTELIYLHQEIDTVFRHQVILRRVSRTSACSLCVCITVLAQQLRVYY